MSEFLEPFPINVQMMIILKLLWHWKFIYWFLPQRNQSKETIFFFFISWNHSNPGAHKIQETTVRAFNKHLLYMNMHKQSGCCFFSLFFFFLFHSSNLVVVATPDNTWIPWERIELFIHHFVESGFTILS